MSEQDGGAPEQGAPRPKKQKKRKKPKRPVPRLARGFRDQPPGKLVARRKMIETVSRVYESYGFTPLETPAIEYVDVLGKFLPESETPEGGIFTWKYDDDEWVALRYDLTAPLSRYVAKNFQELGVPFRRYQAGQVWRLEKPEPGRFREFTQLDIDIVGAGSVLGDAEIVTVLSEAMEALGIERGSYEVRLNDRKVLNGLLEVAGVNEDQVATVLRALDKLDRLGEEGVRLLLGPGRKDAGSGKGEGDFTKGAGLGDEQIETLLRFVLTPAEGRSRYLEIAGELLAESKVGLEGLAEMVELDEILTERGIEGDRVVFDPGVVRGLAYYTGPVVEVVLTYPVPDGQKPFGSVAGGGRYDDLVSRFTGQKVPATGASIGVDRLLDALERLGKVEPRSGMCPVLIAMVEKQYRATYQRWANQLREAGIPTELYVGSGGLGKQFKYADRRQFTAVVVAGGNEIAEDQVSVKDLRLGQELSADTAVSRANAGEDEEAARTQAAADRRAWLEALPGQVTVAEGDLTETVKGILARYQSPSS
ncbi:MAG: histidine--tRNA ligase [Planctomycetes bacterium]|nr:histidine--tRNA ligase [Planctomycetota bacterium]